VPEAGRWEIRGEHGRGGQARVLVVLDRRLGREVARKELPPAEAPGAQASQDGRTRAAEARLVREATITGQLEHPGIVPVYDLGENPDGRPYYLMRLLRGETLARRLKGSAGLAERLRLLGQYWDVCNAVAYAHSRGVVHRDIKPENVMLGSFGETVVLDWGLAKARGQEDVRGRDLEDRLQRLGRAPTDSSSTLAGSVLGTPAYMSPEQASGEVERIDERSDVWSLGAMLYELLSGRTPHQGATPYEIVGKAIQSEVQPVRALCPEAPVELAAIAEKALQRDPAARYPSARELAEEISAYMTGGRVRAHAYRPWELLRRFAARHKAVLSVAALALLILAGVGAWSFVRIAAERDQAQAQRAAAMRFANLLVTDLFDKVEPLAGSTPALDALVKSTLGYYETEVDPSAGAPEERLQLARAYHKIGSLARRLGRAEESRDSQKRAQGTLEPLLLEPASAAEAGLLLANVLQAQALSDLGNGQPDLAREKLERALALSRRQGEREALDSELESIHLDVLSSLGTLELAHGKSDDARQIHTRLLGLRESEAERSPDDEQAQEGLAEALDLGARLAVRTGEPDKARDAWRRGLAIKERLAARHPDDALRQRAVMVPLNKLAQIAKARGEHAESRKLFERALAIARKLHAADPQNIERQFDLAAGLHYMSSVREVEGDIAGALELYQQVLPLAEALAARDTKRADRRVDLAASLERLGDLSLASGQAAQARTYFTRSQALFAELRDVDPSNAEKLIGSLEPAGKLLELELLEGRLAEARRRCLAMLALAEPELERNPSQTDLQTWIAYLELRCGQPARAVELMDRYLEGDPRNTYWTLARLEALLATEAQDRFQALAGPAGELFREEPHSRVALGAYLAWSHLLAGQRSAAAARALEAAALADGLQGGLSLDTWTFGPSRLHLEGLRAPGANALRDLFAALRRWNLGAPPAEVAHAFREFARRLR
jgi:tetratricopeptide (TPR) repeat protein/tRNA A-37 threonylcarbamoyl transferase component Bud32